MIRRLGPHRQGILIPYNGSVAFCAFDEKTQGTPIAKKVDGKILSVMMKFVTSIRQERIPDFVFIHRVRNVALRYHLADLGCLESLFITRFASQSSSPTKFRKVSMVTARPSIVHTMDRSERVSGCRVRRPTPPPRGAWSPAVC